MRSLTCPLISPCDYLFLESCISHMIHKADFFFFEKKNNICRKFWKTKTDKWNYLSCDIIYSSFQWEKTETVIILMCEKCLIFGFKKEKWISHHSSDWNSKNYFNSLELVLHFTINTIILNKITHLISNLMKHLIFFFPLKKFLCWWSVSSFSSRSMLLVLLFISD